MTSHDPVLIGLLALAGFLALVYLLFYTSSGASWLRTAVKTGSVAALAGATWLVDAPSGLMAALGLCAAGDFALSRDGERWFLGGVGAFAAGHIAYIYTFLNLPQFDTTLRALFPGSVLVAGVVVLALVMAWVLFGRTGALRWPVMGYIGIIAAMVVAAAALPLGWLTAGVLLFAASDSVLAIEKFVMHGTGRLRRWAQRSIWATYWPAQGLILLSFL